MITCDIYHTERVGGCKGYDSVEKTTRIFTPAQLATFVTVRTQNKFIIETEDCPKYSTIMLYKKSCRRSGCRDCVEQMELIFDRK